MFPANLPVIRDIVAEYSFGCPRASVYVEKKNKTSIKIRCVIPSRVSRRKSVREKGARG